MNPRIEKVTHVRNKLLEITFKNGEVKVFDVSPYLNFPVYEILKDDEFFKKAHVINETVAWDDEIDLDPDLLYMESQPATLSK